jgi:transcriptional regulator of heat shock response
MAITKLLNIMESEGRNPASHLRNALEYIQNPDKTEECVLVGGINCLPDTAFEQMEETKNIFHKTGKRQGYHVIISFSPEEKVTAEQAMYVLEHLRRMCLVMIMRLCMQSILTGSICMGILYGTVSE